MAAVINKLTPQMLVYVLVQLVEEGVNAQMQPFPAAQAPPTKVGRGVVKRVECGKSKSPGYMYHQKHQSTG